MIKPSSGYAFTRILKDSEAIVESLVKYGHPFKIPPKNPFYYLMDSLMLEAMYRFTGKMKMIFTGMFKYNPAQRVFRFLDERTAPWEVALMILTIPCKHLFIWTVLTDEKNLIFVITRQHAILRRSRRIYKSGDPSHPRAGTRFRMT